MRPEHDELDPRIERLIRIVRDLKYHWGVRGKLLIDDLRERGYSDIEIRNGIAAADVMVKLDKLDRKTQ